MNQQALSSFIWSVADLLRGDYKQSEYSILFDNTGSDEAINHVAELLKIKFAAVFRSNFRGGKWRSCPG